MTSSSESLIVGIVSGILTSALIYLVVSLFEKILLPWYQALIYKGVDIGGEWKWTSENSDQVAVFNIEQKANKIKGVATFVKEGTSSNNGLSNSEIIRTFDIDGQISERFVTFVLKHKDKRRLGISSYLLQIVGDGRKMQGCISGYNINESNIVSDNCELLRKDK